MEEDNEWELSKENVQPLRSGRRMNDLRKALQKDPAILQSEAQYVYIVMSTKLEITRL